MKGISHSLMAILHGKDWKVGVVALELAPIPPSLEGPHDAYQLTLKHRDEVVYSEQHSVHGWQSEHMYVYDIAYAFQCASRMMDARFDFSIYDVVPKWGRKWKAASNLHVSTDWLAFVLQGKTHRQHGPLIIVRALIQLPQTGSGLLERYVSAHFTCSPAEAEAFGTALRAECDAAKVGRKELGLDVFMD